MAGMHKTSPQAFASCFNRLMLYGVEKSKERDKSMGSSCTNCTYLFIAFNLYFNFCHLLLKLVIIASYIALFCIGVGGMVGDYEA